MPWDLDIWLRILLYQVLNIVTKRFGYSINAVNEYHLTHETIN